MDTTHTLISNIGAFSYFGVFVIAILANVVVPVPEEIVIIAIGYVAGTGKINALIALPIVILGLMISDSVMYFLARRGTKLLNAFYDRLFAKSIGSRQDWIDNHTGEVIFYTRFLMQFRFVGPFIAGKKKLPWKTFLSYEVPALLIYVPVLLALGDYFQDRFDAIVSGVGIVRNVILIIIGVLVIVGISKFLRDITFGGYKLSLSGTKEEKMWIPWVYKKKRK